MKQKFSRRDFLKMMVYFSMSSFAFGSGIIAYGSLIEPESLSVEEVDIKLLRLSPQFSGFRIVQLSDIHMGGWMNGKRLRVVIDRVRELNPDLVAITGDFFTGPVWNENLERAAEEFIEEFSRLTKDYSTLGVLGNHDYWSDAQQTRLALERCGIIEIGNRVHSIQRNGEILHFAGVDDVWYEHDDLDQVLSELPDTGEAILLAHEPDFADKSAETARFGLQLSGHSHGGQVVLPVVGAPFLPRLGKKYPSGLYKVGEMWQYTNRGVGMVDLTLRLNCPPEITVLTLHSL